MNYYVVLGIAEGADEETIRRAFRALVRRYHPDAGAGSSPERFREVVDAYETLRDPVRRASYDSSLRASRSRTRHAPVQPIRAEPIAAEPLVEPLGMRFRRQPLYSEKGFFTEDILFADTLEQLFAQVLDEGFGNRFFFRRLL